jgi:archaemetzincin
MPRGAGLLRERPGQRAVHELGHTFGLRHCADWRCVMASSHAVERLDVRVSSFATPAQVRVRKWVFEVRPRAGYSGPALWAASGGPPPGMLSVLI